MTTKKSTESTTRNGWNPSTIEDDDALDQVIEDSFPASDPPSHTPTTSLGAPKGTQEDEPRGRQSNRWARLAAGFALALVAAAGAVATMRWRRGRERGRVHQLTDRFRHAA